MDDPRRAAPQALDPPTQYSALQAVLPHVLRTFKREPALALTACYLFVALAGIYFDYGFYQRGFGIPILSLSQIGDFLAAGLQQPFALALLVSTLPLCWLIDRLNLRRRRKEAARRTRLQALSQPTWWQRLQLRHIDWHLGFTRWVPLFYLLIVLVYGWNFILLYSAYRIHAVKAGNVPRVIVRMNGDAADLRASDPKGWGYLGAVSNYVFVYDPVAKKSLVLPVNAIQRVEPEGPKSARSAQIGVVRLPQARYHSEFADVIAAKPRPTAACGQGAAPPRHFAMATPMRNHHASL